MTTTITVFLNPMPGQPEDTPTVMAGHYEIGGDTHAEICNTAFAVFNSYLAEMHCSIDYAAQVGAYRNARYRSLSVGDVIVIHDPAEDVAFRCDPVGFSACELPNSRRLCDIP